MRPSVKGHNFTQNAKFSATKETFFVLKEVGMMINTWGETWAVQQHKHKSKCTEFPCRWPSSSAAELPLTLDFWKASTASPVVQGSFLWCFNLSRKCESPHFTWIHAWIWQPRRNANSFFSACKSSDWLLFMLQWLRSWAGINWEKFADVRGAVLHSSQV